MVIVIPGLPLPVTLPVMRPLVSEQLQVKLAVTVPLGQQGSKVMVWAELNVHDVPVLLALTLYFPGQGKAQ